MCVYRKKMRGIFMFTCVFVCIRKQDIEGNVHMCRVLGNKVVPVATIDTSCQCSPHGVQ